MLEAWRPVFGYQCRYWISSSGNVWSEVTGRHLRPGLASHGYLTVALSSGDGTRASKAVHRLVAAAFLGISSNGLQVNHKNGRKTDNRLENLEYCTAAFNTAHSYRLGLSSQPSGAANSKAKLTERQVRQIRQAAGNASHAALANDLGVSKKTVWNVIHRKKYKCVD